MNFMSCAGTGLSKRRIFREKTVARMNRVRAAAFRDLQNLVDVEIRLSRSCGANGVGLVRHQNMQSGAIDIGKDSSRENSQLAAGANHPHRDLSPIGDKNLLEHSVGASAPLVLPRHGLQPSEGFCARPI